MPPGTRLQEHKEWLILKLFNKNPLVDTNWSVLKTQGTVRPPKLT